MAKRSVRHRRNQPVNPVIATILAMVVISSIIILSTHSGQNALPQQAEHQARPSLSPTPTLSLAPTPTLAYGQKAIYTYYVRASGKTEPKSIGLTPFNTGRVFNVDIGSLFILNKFNMGNLDISHSSQANIFTNYGAPEHIHLPAYAEGSVRVYRAGVGTIQVIEAE